MITRLTAGRRPLALVLGLGLLGAGIGFGPQAMAGNRPHHDAVDPLAYVGAPLVLPGEDISRPQQNFRLQTFGDDAIW